MSQLRLIRASAGSGKTYTLTAAYIRLLFKYSGSFRNILAVTFTNKATAEMKNRILLELYYLSNEKEDSDHLSGLMNEFKLSETDVRTKAKAILDSILHNYSRFSVNTIDSFFQRIIKSFAREAGIQFNYDVELDVNQVLEKAADVLMTKLDSDKTLLEWIITYSEKLIDDGKNWDPRKNIIKIGKEIFNEQFINLPREFHDKIANREYLKTFQTELNKHVHEFEKTLKEFGTKGMQIIEKQGLQPTDFKYASKGSVGMYFLRLSKGNTEAPSARVIEATESVESWLPKDKAIAAQVQSAADSGLWQLFLDAMAYFQNQLENYKSCNHALKNFYTLGVIADISQTIHENAANDNTFVLANSGPFLKAIIGENDTPFIYEKAGQTFKHFMIDEFQDTSGIQWDNFNPLISDSLAANQYSMLVGDVKQSIYRWRSTDWKIMAAQVEKDMQFHGLNIENLPFNWRSKANIIQFNNSIFHFAPRMIKGILENEVPEANMDETLRKFIVHLPLTAYEAHEQKIPTKTPASSGHISVRFFDNSQKDYIEQSLSALPGIIEQLCAKGYKLKDIAILVRKAKEGRAIFDFLNEFKQKLPVDYPCRFDVLSNESAYVSSSPAVQFLLKVFRYMVYPNDKINICALLNDYAILFPNSAFLGISLTGNFVELACQKEFSNILEEKLGRFKSLSPDGLLESLIELTGINTEAVHLPFIQAFHDCVAGFSSSHAPSVSAFLEYWEEIKDKLSISVSDQQDAIRILSIHKSKGLEFKNVIIPFCDWNFDHSGTLAPTIWCSSDRAPFNMLPVIPVGYSSELKETVFADDYYLEKGQIWVDNLNLLYVALTRAENNLFIAAPKPSYDKISKVSDLLYGIFKQAAINTVEPNQLALSEGWKADSEQFLYGEICPPDVSKKKMLIPSFPATLDSYSSFAVEEKLRQRAISPFFKAENKPKGEQRLYGNFMHRLFQDIKTGNDIQPALQKAFESGLITSESMQALQIEITNLISQSPYNEWYSEKWQVRNEAEIVVPRSHQYRPDRVMIGEKEAIVVDYKFGFKEKDEYLLQVREYMECLKAMNIEKVEGFVWYVSLNKTVKV